MGTGFLAPQGCGGQSERGQTQLTSFGPSLAEPEADSESFIDVTSWFQTPGGRMGTWWGQQQCVGGLCLEGKTPTTVRDCHQKLVGFKLLNLSEEDLEAQLSSGCVGGVTSRPGGRWQLW